MFSGAGKTKTDLYPKRDIVVSPLHLVEERKNLELLSGVKTYSGQQMWPKASVKGLVEVSSYHPRWQDSQESEEREPTVGHEMDGKLSCEQRGGLHRKWLHRLSPEPHREGVRHMSPEVGGEQAALWGMESRLGPLHQRCLL